MRATILSQNNADDVLFCDAVGHCPDRSLLACRCAARVIGSPARPRHALGAAGPAGRATWAVRRRARGRWHYRQRSCVGKCG